jgi:hypothetical protein
MEVARSSEMLLRNVQTQKFSPSYNFLYVIHFTAPVSLLSLHYAQFPVNKTCNGLAKRHKVFPKLFFTFFVMKTIYDVVFNHNKFVYLFMKVTWLWLLGNVYYRYAPYIVQDAVTFL